RAHGPAERECFHDSDPESASTGADGGGLSKARHSGVSEMARVPPQNRLRRPENRDPCVGCQRRGEPARSLHQDGHWGSGD
ncbi:MAG: hypothetical protein OXD42_06120, partial [Rhodospirillaceae bacterium]|nr:hypothetical protein [Rhodospirillaceae bacterium]